MTRSPGTRPTSASTSSPALIETHRVHAYPAPGLLGGHRDHPRVLRGQPRPLRARAAVQLLRLQRADLHPRALSARTKIINGQHRALDHLRWLHHQRRRTSSIADRRAEPHPGRRDHPGRAHHGRRTTTTAPTGRRCPARPPSGIGHDSCIERTIVDKNARIGDDVRITPRGQGRNFDGPDFYVRDGIVIIPKNAIVPDGTII